VTKATSTVAIQLKRVSGVTQAYSP
jgi:hypothetical protein